MLLNGRFFYCALSLFFIFFNVTSYAQSNFIEGEDYEIITPKESGSTPPTKVDVLEFFSYTCPYCNQLAPLIKSWGEENLDKVNMMHSSVPGSSSNHPWTTFSRLYYTTEALNVEDQTHFAIFHAYHTKRNPMSNTNLMWQELAVYMESKGITKEEFESTFNSFSVNLKVEQARKEALGVNLQGTPTILLDNRILVKSSRKGIPAMVSTTEYLVDEILAGRK